MVAPKSSPEHLPSGVLQAIIFCVEECRDHLRSGQTSTKRQIQAASYLSPVDRARILPGLTAQLEHYERCEGALDYLLTRCKQRMRWPSIVRNMPDSELKDSHIDLSLWDAMQWNRESEQSKVSSELVQS